MVEIAKSRSPAIRQRNMNCRMMTVKTWILGGMAYKSTCCELPSGLGSRLALTDSLAETCSFTSARLS
jgi:hypothetical protein